VERQGGAVRADVRALNVRWGSALAVTCFALPLASRAEAPATPAYEDRLLDATSLPPLGDDEGGAPFNPEGMPREWRVEGFASRVDQGGTVRHENGMVLSTRLDTLEHGSISVDATVRNESGGSVVTLWQRGLPFDNGWRANNGIGMINTPGIELGRQQYRFFLPTFPIAGVSTEWQQGQSLQLQASVGEPGVYNGLRLAGFSRLGGTLATAGAQWSGGPNVQVGVQAADANNVGASVAGDVAAARIDARSMYGAMAYQAGDTRVQLNLLDSEANDTRHAVGAWLDGEFRDGRYRHNYGVFRFEPNLSWGYVPINSDAQGAYYRLNYQSQQWIWSAGVDSIGSVTPEGSSALFGTGSVRYQVDHSTGVGGGANFRKGGSDAASAFAFLDKQTALGTTRVQLDVVAAQGAQHSEQVTADHAWPLQVGLHLSTSLSLGEERAPEEHTRRASFAAFGGIDVTNTLTLEGNVRWSLERTTVRSVGRYANVGLVWRMSPRWSLVGTYYDNRSEFPAFATIAPLVPVEAPPPIPRDRAIFVTVRYEDRAGTPVAPLGGPPGSGAGVLKGSVFYDANDDGRRNANEQGAANVTVILDGRFATRTDGEGRFEFPLVASGTHSLMVVPDNLALPWSVADDGKRQVAVSTRETTTVEIAATRMR